MDKHTFEYCPPIKDGYLTDDISRIPGGYISYKCTCPHTKGAFRKRAFLVAHIRRAPHREWLNNKNMTQHEKSITSQVTNNTPVFVPENTIPDPKPIESPEPVITTDPSIEIDVLSESYYEEESIGITTQEYTLLNSKIQNLEYKIQDMKKYLNKPFLKFLKMQIWLPLISLLNPGYLKYSLIIKS